MKSRSKLCRSLLPIPFQGAESKEWFHLGCALLGVGWVLGLGQSSLAQGIIVLHTGGGLPLVSSSQTLVPPPGSDGLPLEFEFGFATDEVVVPGAFLDSLTVTIQDAMARTLVLLTADANGVVWAPPTPGAVFISPNAIVRVPIPFPLLQPPLAQQWAFATAIPLPPELIGPIQVYFDLFDNFDSTHSLAWYRDARIPEPRTAALLLAGSCLLWLRRLRGRQIRPPS